MSAYINATRPKLVDRFRVMRKTIVAIEPHEVSQQLIGHRNYDFVLGVA